MLRDKIDWKELSFYMGYLVAIESIDHLFIEAGLDRKYPGLEEAIHHMRLTALYHINRKCVETSILVRFARMLMKEKIEEEKATLGGK